MQFVRTYVRSRLEGANALVVHAGSAPGCAFAVALAKEGCTLLLLDCRENAAALDVTKIRVLEALPKGAGVSTLMADLSTPAGLDALTSQAALTMGDRVDLVMFAPMPANSDTYDVLDNKAISGTVCRSLLAPMLITRRLLPSMKQRGGGIVVLVTSPLAYASVPCLSPVCASQAGVAAWALALRAELKGTGISVANVASGFLAGDGPEVPGMMGYLVRTPQALLLRICVATCACAAPFGTMLATLLPWPILGALQDMLPDTTGYLLRKFVFCGQVTGAPAGVFVCSPGSSKAGSNAGQSKE